MGTQGRLELVVRHDDPQDVDALRAQVAARAELPLEAVSELRVKRRVIDARRRIGEPVYRLTVDVALEAAPRAPLELAAATPDPAPITSPRARADAGRVVVVGAGPAGLFAAWHLAEQGARVVLVERGKPVETRARDFGQFRGRGILDPESNLCFGEGGAGTYSDGKLYTRTKSPLVVEVMRRLVEVGAPEHILVEARPHIGTNVLFRMLKALRQRLVELGVELRFQTKMARVLVDAHGHAAGIETHAGEAITGERVVLAFGHSARDTFRALLDQGLPMMPKPFALGVRIEHPQSLIDASQYHQPPPRPTTLPPSDYHLTHDARGRGVYSFCMCPGGMIVPTATEPGTVVVNGMSTASRGTPFANSGLVVQVELADLAREGFGEHPLAGVEFQRAIEVRAFEVGGGHYHAPAMRADDVVRGKATGRLADTHFRPGLTPSDLRDVLPAFVVDALRDGVRRFDGQIRGYGSSVANLIAVESRTSSPIRIPRDEATLEVLGFPGVYVAGEGPGYAGGIASAAVDGLRVAQAALRAMA